MKSKEIQTGILINPKAGDKKSIRQTIETTESSFGDTQIYDIADIEDESIQNISPRLIIIGGDGTIRACLSWLASHNEYPQILIAGGGSTNTFRSALIKEGAKTSVKALKNDAQRTISYKPAVIEHEDAEKDFWIIAAGFGEFERDFTNAFETVRKLKTPPSTRAHTAGLMTLMYNFLTVMSSHDPLLQTYTTGQNIGPFKVFKKNELSLSSNKLGLVEIDKKDYYRGLLRFVISSMFWQARIKPPKSLAQTTIGESFITELSSFEKMSRINLDGDEEYIQSGRLLIRRHPHSFSASALVFERKTQDKI